MNAAITKQKEAFMGLFILCRAELNAMTTQQLTDLLHESEDLCRQIQLDFSLRAAAQLVHAACTDLLEERK